jgi:eukaryotic-like serine/threonine-protein kinase
MMAAGGGGGLGPYEILAPIDAGGMGEVFRTDDPRTEPDVAIKISAECFSDRFSREVHHTIAELNHPNICHLYDVGPDYLMMEPPEGPTLGERIKQGAVSLEEALIYERFSSRGEADFADKVLSALRFQFGGHEEEAAARKADA